ncbi:MAG TPA: hypothetical protein VLQ90_07785 [Pyrinomonadaceae bacterium]|nr:hypothetical protein [Pyrinomonadaceae bacterium]
MPDHEVLAMMICCTKWAAVKAQEFARDQLRRDLPQYSERELWRAVIVTRLGAKLQLEMTKMNFEIEMDSVTEDLSERMESMDEIMAGINSWDDVVNYVLEMDKESFENDPMGVKGELNRILMD